MIVIGKDKKGALDKQTTILIPFSLNYRSEDQIYRQSETEMNEFFCFHS